VHSIKAILSNLHLLLRVASFARWPLTLRLFDREVHVQWTRYLGSDGVEPLRATLEVVTDFKPAAVLEAEAKKEGVTRQRLLENREDHEESDHEGEEEPEGLEWGIHALPLDYAPLAPYLEKGRNVTTFEREGRCVVCFQHLEHDKGLYAICPSGECEGMGHLDCWSRYLLHQQGEDDGTLLPVDGRCPKCSGAVKWGDMMRELTLRIRGQKEVEKVLKRSRRIAGVAKPMAKPMAKPKAKRKRKAKADADALV
jgi:structure-specific endonuclease subunit SLX1